jgi:hypothetical protein
VEQLEARRRVVQVLQQRTLPDPRLTAHYENPALTPTGGVEQILDRAALLGPPDQVGGRRGRPEMGPTVDGWTLLPSPQTDQGHRTRASDQKSVPPSTLTSAPET